jgi:hypothetical protein
LHAYFLFDSEKDVIDDIVNVFHSGQQQISPKDYSKKIKNINKIAREIGVSTTIISNRLKY